MPPEPKTVPAQQYDDFVAECLDAARRRIQRIDMVGVLLTFLIGVVGYGVLVLTLDTIFRLNPMFRMGLFVLGVVGVSAFLAHRLYLSFARQLNPYYVAQLLEKTVPNSKGSVVNYLDLRDEQLPAAIRLSLTTSAARDLKQADPEVAIRHQRLFWLAGIFGLLTVVLVVLFATSRKPFTSSVAEVYLPFQSVGQTTRTKLEVVDPKEPNLIVGQRDSVTFKVRVTGEIPRQGQKDSVRLLYRYGKNDPYRSQALEPGPDDLWATTLLPNEIRGGGVFYKIAGGDYETTERTITVVTKPRIRKFRIVYEPRNYHHRKPFLEKFSVDPVIDEFEGTKVTVVISADRRIRTGKLHRIEAGQQQTSVNGTRLSDDPQSMAFSFVLKESGTFAVRFLDEFGKNNSDPGPYKIQVEKDEVPQVELKVPGKDLARPTNGFVELAGVATDRVGIRRLVLQLSELSGDTPLKPIVLSGGDLKPTIDGRYPQREVFRQIIQFGNLKLQDDTPFVPQVGMKLAYHLEAHDECDLPRRKGQVGKSKTYHIVFLAPETDSNNLKQKFQKALKKQKEHEKKQEQRRKKQNEQIKKQQKRDQEQKKKNNSEQKGASASKQQGDAGTAKENRKNDGKNSKSGTENKSGKTDKGESQQQKQQRENLAKKINQLKKQLGDKKQNEGTKSSDNKGKGNDSKDGKGDSSGPGATKAQQQISQLEKKASNDPDPNNRQQAKQELQKMASGDRSKQTRQAAKEALDRVNKNSSGNKDPNPDPQMKKVQQLSKQAQDGDDPQQQEQAQKELEKLTKEGKDQQVRDAAKKALDQARESTQRPTDAKTPQTNSKDGGQPNNPDAQKRLDRIKQLEKEAKSLDSDQSHKAKQELKKMEDESKDSNTKKAVKDALDRVKQHAAELETREQQKQIDDLEKKATDNPDPTEREQAKKKLEELSQKGKKQRTRDQAKKALERSNDPELRELLDHIQNLKNQAKNDPDPDRQSQAKKELQDLRKMAKNQQARDAAKQALDQTPKQGQNGMGKKGMGEGNQPQGKGKGPEGQGKTGPSGSGLNGSNKNGPNNSGNGKAEMGKKGTSEGAGIPNRKTPGAGRPETGGRTKSVKEFERYVMGLQLVDIRKKLTPQMLKKLNWTAEDAKQTLKQLAEYQRSLKERSKGKSLLDVGTNKLGSVDLTELERRSDSRTDPIDLERGTVPRGYSEALRRLTSSTNTPDDSAP